MAKDTASKYSSSNVRGTCEDEKVRSSNLALFSPFDSINCKGKEKTANSHIMLKTSGVLSKLDEIYKEIASIHN